MIACVCDLPSMKSAVYPMNDNEKSKDQLIKELEELRKCIGFPAAEDGFGRAAVPLNTWWTRYRLIAENASDLIALTTFAFNPTYTYVSPSHKAVMGYNPEDLIGKQGLQFIHPEDKKRLLPLLNKYLSLKIKNILSAEERTIMLDQVDSLLIFAQDRIAESRES